MSHVYVASNASAARRRDAERARSNRAEIVRELSWGRISRRDLIKWGLFTSAGLLAPIGGLSPFVATASAASLDDGAGVPRSPLFGAKPFTQPMPRFDVLPRGAVSTMTPYPLAEANQTPIAVPAELGGGYGPCEGRPPTAVWAHQRFNEFFPNVCVEVTQSPATINTRYRPQVDSSLNSHIDPAHSIAPRFHPNMPVQNPNSVWTFNG